MATPSYPLVIERRVAFSQTDAAGLIHFTTYFTLMEEAEATLFRKLGIHLLEHDASGSNGFPRVDCQCKFRRPLGFDDLVSIELSVNELDSRRIHYAFRFLNEQGKLCASGTMVTAAARRSHGGKLEGSALPDAVMMALESWKMQAD